VFSHAHIQKWIARKHHEEWLPIIAVGLFTVALSAITALVWTILELEEAIRSDFLVQLDISDEIYRRMVFPWHDSGINTVPTYQVQ
jgi:hypothetical protein